MFCLTNDSVVFRDFEKMSQMRKLCCTSPSGVKPVDVLWPVLNTAAMAF